MGGRLGRAKFLLAWSAFSQREVTKTEKNKQGLMALLPWKGFFTAQLHSRNKKIYFFFFFKIWGWGLLLYSINHFFFHEFHFLFLVMFIHISSIYIKLDTPYFHRVQIKRAAHCWPSSCSCFNNSNIFHSKASKRTASQNMEQCQVK